MRSRAGYLELGICGLVWGSIGVIVRHVSLGAPAIVFFRLAIGAGAVIGWFAARGRIRELRMRDQRALLVSDGILLAVHWVAFFAAYKRLSVATTILIVYIGPVLVAAGAPKIVGERIKRRTVASLAISLGGLAM